MVAMRLKTVVEVMFSVGVSVFVGMVRVEVVVVVGMCLTVMVGVAVVVRECIAVVVMGVIVVLMAVVRVGAGVATTWW